MGIRNFVLRDFILNFMPAVARVTYQSLCMGFDDLGLKKEKYSGRGYL